MNSIVKNEVVTDNGLPPVQQPARKKSKARNHERELSLSEILVSENNRSPCYIQRQRIKSVLNELYKKIIIVGLLPDTLGRHFINVFDSDIALLLKKYLDVKNEYMSVRKTTTGEINKLYLNEVIKKYKIAVRNVYRAFLFSPESHLRLMRYQSENKIQKPIEVQKFEKAVTEILNFLNEKLETTYEQDQKMQKEIKDITDIELKKKEKVENFKAILKNAINERYENITEKTKEMEHYKDELEKFKITSSSNILRIQNNSKQIIERDKKLSSDKQRQITTEINLLNKKLSEKIAVNKEEENAHLKKKFRIESEIENWIHRYDDEVSKKQEEFESLTKKYNEQHTALLELQEKYTNLQEVYKQEKEERELKRQQEEERTYKMVLIRHCGLVILRFYKAYLKRKQARLNNTKRRR